MQRPHWRSNASQSGSVIVQVSLVLTAGNVNTAVEWTDGQSRVRTSALGFGCPGLMSDNGSTVNQVDDVRHGLDIEVVSVEDRNTELVLDFLHHGDFVDRSEIIHGHVTPSEGLLDEIHDAICRIAHDLIPLIDLHLSRDSGDRNPSTAVACEINTNDKSRPLQFFLPAAFYPLRRHDDRGAILEPASEAAAAAGVWQKLMDGELRPRKFRGEY